MAEWEIQKPLGQCFGTEKKFETGQEYFATLVLTDEGFQRRDYSIEYWNQNKPQVYCFWKTRLPDPQEKKKLYVDDQMLMAFFDRLSVETDQEKINFRFVLALILMQKRRLKYLSSENRDGLEIWTVRVVGQDRTEEVVNPNLDTQQIENLSEQMNNIMQVDL